MKIDFWKISSTSCWSFLRWGWITIWAVTKTLVICCLYGPYSTTQLYKDYNTPFSQDPYELIILMKCQKDFSMILFWDLHTLILHPFISFLTYGYINHNAVVEQCFKMFFPSKTLQIRKTLRRCLVIVGGGLPFSREIQKPTNLPFANVVSR